MKKKITIVTPCYNEEDNVGVLYERVKAVFAGLPQYDYEHLFIDNASTDKTVEILKGIAAKDKNVKLIVNSRNFGHIRSPFYAMMQAQGDAVVSVVADLQDPPEMIKTFLEKWEEGYPIVVGVKPASKEAKLTFLLRRCYYRMLSKLSEVELIENFTGFGLYDKKIIAILRQVDDPYPYFRGLISEVGFDIAKIPFTQPRRTKGISKNNFYTLYDMAMLGITSHSKLPLRIATMAGFLLSGLSLLVSIIYLILKLIFWRHFALGEAPILIGIFFFSAIQLFFIGLIGEYISMIHTRLLKRPLVIEKERVNFGTNKTKE